MPRIDVPDGFDAGSISVAGERDANYGAENVVSVEGVRHARDLSVREDEDGRYVGPQEEFVGPVVEYLNDVADADLNADDYLPDDGKDDEEEDAEDGEAETEAEVSDVEQSIDDGVCPWCDDYEGDGVPQHASSAHSEEWAEYKEDSD